MQSETGALNFQTVTQNGLLTTVLICNSLVGELPHFFIDRVFGILLC